MSLQFVSYGFVRSCCTAWSKLGPIGHLHNDRDIIAIWNSDRIQRIRRAVIEDRMETVCNLDICPHALEKKNIVLDQIVTDDPNFKHLIEQIKRGETKLDRPPLKILISDSGECNLRCIMCTSNNRYAAFNPEFARRLFEEILPQALPYAMRLNLTGNGEPLFRRETREFLMNQANAINYPNLKIDLVTNGLLLNESMWEKIKHNRFFSINVSCDAANRETYEAVRVNGNWDVLLKNLQLISDLRKQGIFNRFSVSYVVIKKNHTEIEEFIQTMSAFQPDEIRFQRATGMISVRENINFTKDKSAYKTIANLQEKEIFHEKHVNARALDVYTNYKDSNTALIQKINTRLLVILFSFPMRYFYKIRKHLVPLYRVFYTVSVRAERSKDIL